MNAAGVHGLAAAGLDTSTPVVVMNTHHSGLAVARDLGPLGIRVIGITAEPRFHGNRSRWLEYRPAPDSLGAAAELLAFLRVLALELGVRGVLLPTRDHDVNFINCNREVLENQFLIPMPDVATLERIMNKDALASVAAEAGIRTPRTVVVRTAGALGDARGLRYPCVCKPLYASQWRRPGIWEAVGRQKALKVDSFSDLERFHSRFSALDPVVAVQEWVEGGEDALQIFGSYCGADHRVLAAFTARKRLQYPPLAGTGIIVEGLPLPGLLEPSATLLEKLRHRGMSEIEYKRDARDGRLYLIEVNPRHWDQHGLGTKVGVNLSEAMYRDVTGQMPRSMVQDGDPVLWIAEAEYARHVLRCLTGRAPLGDLSLACGGRRTWTVFDRRDLGPLASLAGLRVG